MLKKIIKNIRNSYTAIQLRKVWPFVRPYKGRALLALLLAIPLGAMDAVIAWSLKPLMDNVMVEKSIETAMYIPIAILVFSFFQALLTYSVNYLNSWVGLKITFNLKRAMYDKLLSFETSFYDNMNMGDIFIRFSSDVDIACNSLVHQAKLMVTRFFSSVSLICVLLYHSWQLAIVAIISLLIALYPLKTYRRRIKQFNKESIDENGKLVTNYVQSIAGQKVISSFNLKELQLSLFDTTISRLFRLNMKITQRTAFLPAIMTMCVASGIAFIIWYGSYLILSGELTAGGFVSFIAALIMLLNPIKRIGGGFASLQSSLLAMERIFELYEKEYKIKNKENAVDLKNARGNIVFKNVSFQYESGTPVLKNINLSVKAGETVALVGNSGGGKSTIISLITRFYDPQDGVIMLDGKPLHDYTLESLRDNIATVLQDNFLFTGTIRDNVALGGDYADEEIIKAIKAAQLEDFINDSENGVYTDVGENGSALSGGQKQRVAIARAFLKDAPIIILDEATSALDNKSEKAVQVAMDKLMKGRTVFVIAHRLSTITGSNKIIVINDGEVVEEGTHDGLVANEDGHYNSLYKLSIK